MWGLDAAEPSVAIATMQAMNASAKNVVFAPAFFGTPLILLATAALAWHAGRRASAGAFLAAGLTYLLGGLALTMTVNVPMIEALALAGHSARTVASGLALMLAGYGLHRLRAG